MVGEKWIIGIQGGDTRHKYCPAIKRMPGAISGMAKLTLKYKIEYVIEREQDMLYVIQTITGKEQELVEAIENVLVGTGKKETYERCFVLYRECIWRIEGRLRLHVEPLFPSYVFAETKQPEAFFLALKQVPKLARLLGSDGNFSGIDAEEEQFFKQMLEAAEKEKDQKSGRYLVRRSLVQVDSEGQIIEAEGILKNYLGQIVKQRLRKRSVIIEMPFLGEMRRIQLGIRLGEDAAEA